MPQRNIIHIDEEKCTGCGLCAEACVEGAIEIIDGKARLVSESYCDGLGACIGECPEGAITIETREAEPFDEEAAKRHQAQQARAGHACPGAAAQTIARSSDARDEAEPAESELTHWPVQLKLVAPGAPYFDDADLLLTGDCVPFAMGDFHRRFLRGRPVVVGCPKLDDAEYYVEKMTEILAASTVKSLTVVHMEVPCCFGLRYIAERAAAACGKSIPIRDVTVAIDGSIKEEA